MSMVCIVVFMITMNFQLSSVFAASLIVIGNCASYDVLDRSLRGTLRQQLDDCNSQVVHTRLTLNFIAHLTDF